MTILSRACTTITPTTISLHRVVLTTDLRIGSALIRFTNRANPALLEGNGKKFGKSQEFLFFHSCRHRDKVIIPEFIFADFVYIFSDRLT